MLIIQWSLRIEDPGGWVSVFISSVSQAFNVQTRELWAGIVFDAMDEPPEQGENDYSDEDDRVP